MPRNLPEIVNAAAQGVVAEDFGNGILHLVIVGDAPLREGGANAGNVQTGDAEEREQRVRVVVGRERETQVNPVVGEAQFVGHRRREDMRLGNEEIVVFGSKVHVKAGESCLPALRLVGPIREEASRKLVIVRQFVIDPELELAVRRKGGEVPEERRDLNAGTITCCGSSTSASRRRCC